MSRLWSRLGVRALSLVLLLAGVAGGVYLSQDRQIQQQGIDAQLVVQADGAERRVQQEQQSAHAAAVAPQREAEAEAAAKAAGAAKAAAARAEKAKVAVSRKTERKAPTTGSGDADAGADADEAPADKPKPKPSFTGPIPKSCEQYSGPRKIACALVVDKGMGMDQMACLDRLWKKESGWNPKAANPSSGAYGIPQALPGKKMASVGADWKTNPATQIKWGLGYIAGRYGKPCGAWSHSQSRGWY